MPTNSGTKYHIYGVTMRENQYIVVCSATSVESCLYRRVLKGSVRVRPSGMNLIVNNKNNLDFAKTEELIHNWMKCDFWTKRAEMQYKNVKPYVLIEKSICVNGVSGALIRGIEPIVRLALVEIRAFIQHDAAGAILCGDFAVDNLGVVIRKGTQL